MLFVKKSAKFKLHVSHQNRFNLFWEVLNTGPLLFCYMHQYMLWNTSCHSSSIRSISLYRNLLTKFLLTSYIISRGLIFKDENVNSLSNSFSAISIYKYSWEWFGGGKLLHCVYKEKRAWKYFTTIDVRFGIVYSVLYLMCAYTCNKIS